MPFGEYKTYYRIAGECAPGKKPLLLLHGGPGSTHNYFEVLDPLAEEGRALIMYDQLGCGLSSQPADADYLWTSETWLEELAALRRHLGLTQVHLMGQSWGGMLAIQYMCDENPDGIVSLILSSTLSSNAQWEKEGRRNISYLPKEMQEAIVQAEATNDYSSAAYQAAEDAYMARHCFAMPPEEQPECMRRPTAKGRRSYLVAWGQNEFTPTGTLKNYEYRDKISEISVPTLVTSGLMDLCTPLVAKTMTDAIPGAKWELFEFSRHTAFVEENEKYLRVLGAWLNEHD